MSWFSLLHFAHPGLLLLGAAAPALILAYLQRNPLKRTVVSSIIILKRIPKAPALKRRMKLPLRFFLELLALLLLTGAAAMPFLNDRGEHVAILIDNSLSMRAASGDKGSRFDDALSSTDDWLVEQDRSNSYTVFVPAPTLTLIGSGDLNREAARRVVRGIKAGFSSDSLGGAVSELLSQRKYERVFVVSDQDAERDEGDSIVETRRVGRSASNAYIANLRSERSRLQEEMTVTASIGFSGPQATEIRARLSAISGTSERELSSTKARIEDGKITEVTFNVPIPELGTLYHARITADDDVLPEDNEGWISPDSRSGSEVLLVGVPDPDLRGLARIRGIHVTQLTPYAYTRLSDQDLRKYSSLIFYQVAPRIVPKISSVLILPPNENPLFPVRVDVSAPSISSWKAEHPITTYLNVPVLKPKVAQIFEPVPWAQAVLNAEQGALIIAGESQGVRFAGVGFEILPFEGSDTPGPSVLLLNLLQWLSGGGELSATKLTGSALKVDSGRISKVIDPRGEVKELAGGSSLYTFDQPGIYVIQSAERTFLPVNPFHADESSTFETHYFRVPVASSVQSVTGGETPFWPKLLLAVIAVLFLDLFLVLLAPVFRRGELQHAKEVS